MRLIFKEFSKKMFKRRLYERTMCQIQHNGWTCGTCFFNISEKLTNKDWNALLIYRGDYDFNQTNEWRKERGEEPLTREQIKESLLKIWELIRWKE